MEIYYKNFKPRKKESVKMNVLLSRLEEYLPSIYSSCICIEKENDGTYCATFRVRSPEGRFGCASTGRTIERLIQNVSREVGNQLSKWRDVRFTNRAPRDPLKPFYSFREQCKIFSRCKQKGCPSYRRTGVWVGSEKRSA